MIIFEDQIWMIVVGFFIAFVLAFGLGANDVANTFGSSVGSGVLTLKQACFLATICEMLGAVLLGAKVSNTMRKGIVDIELFAELENGPAVLMAGQVAALGGSCIWLMVATFFRLPVSGTHSIVGATVGFSLVVFGVNAIHWMGVVRIVISWFVSPVLSGLISVGIFYIIHFLVLTKEESYEPGLRVLPGFYGAVVFVNAFSIIYGAPPSFKFDKIPLWGIFIVSGGLGCITVVAVKFIMLPYLRKRFIAKQSAQPRWVANVSKRLGDCISEMKTYCKRRHSCSCFKSKRDSSELVTPSGKDLKENARDLPANPQIEAGDVTEMQAFSVDSTTNKIGVPMNGSVRVTGDNMHNQVASGHTKMQRAKQFHSGPEISERTKNADGTRVFEVIPTPVGTRSTADNGSATAAISAFSIEPPNVDFVDGTMSLTKRSVLARPSLPPIGEEPEARAHIKDRPSEARVFSLLQVMTAVFGSFAHGGNDVSNAIGPLIGLWIVGITHEVNSKMPIPIWLLLYGGAGISIGLCVWGRRVIQTLGKDLARITPSSGVCIEIGSALTVLVASKAGLPVSTTHCQVGSVVGVGRARSRDNVNWGIFRNIIIAWVVTVPAAAAMSALLMYCFTFIV